MRPHVYKLNHRGKHESYLFGTFHLWPGPLPDVDRWLLQCERFVMESIPSADMLDRLREMTPSSAVLSPDQLEVFSRMTDRPAELLGSLPLGIIMAFPAGHPEKVLQEIAEDGQVHVLELELHNAAREAGLEVGSLEDILEVASGIEKAALPILGQVMGLIERDKEMNVLLPEAWDAYVCRDLDRFVSLIKRTSAMFGANPLGDYMIRARNEAWVPVIAQHMEEASSFIAVGYGHLIPEMIPDEPGLLERLEKEGFEIEPL